MRSRVQANLGQVRSAYEKAAENMKAVGEAATTALTKQQALTHELGNRVIENTNANIAATFDVAEQLARSRSVQDMLKNPDGVRSDAVQAHRRTG